MEDNTVEEELTLEEAIDELDGEIEEMIINTRAKIEEFSSK